MIVGVKSASGNMVAQMYVTYFGDIIVHPLTHRIEAHTSLSQYFMYAGVPEHLHSYNTW